MKFVFDYLSSSNPSAAIFLRMAAGICVVNMAMFSEADNK
jgi:hypothetical protein